MACKVLKLTGWIDGEHKVYAAGTEYVAGQPLKLSSNGLELAVNPEDVMGLSKNDRKDDLAVGPQAADALASGYAKGSFVAGINKFQMSAGTLASGSSRSPFKATPTTGGAWAEGQRIFLASDGTWDNAPAASNDPPFGTVTKPATSSDPVLEGVWNSTGGYAYSAIAT